MKTTRIAGALAATATAGVIFAPFASADAAEPAAPDTQSLGSQAKLVNGDVIQAWTISNLKPSSDVIPHMVNGTLWEATATDQAIQGSVTPIVSNLNARAADGQNYRALFGAATPQGVNPSTLAQGQETSGKVYFDVTVSTPNSVVYNSGGQDLAVWTQAPQTSSSSGTQTPYRSYPSTSSYPATSPAADAPETTPAAPAATPGAPGAEGMPAAAAEAPLPAGSMGTPLPAGSMGTPLPAGSQGTPLPAGTPGAPVPAGSQGTPVPAGQGTPVPPAEGAPVMPPAEGAPTPAPQPASQGTPVAPGADQAPMPTIYEPTP
jgi:Domain of unknown function (DUF1942)